MNFLVDAQLPPGLCEWLAGRGHGAIHISELLDQPVSDWRIAEFVARGGYILVSKDEDFVRLREPDGFALLWLRCGNISNRGLREWLEPRWPDVERRLAAGERFITLE